jgi:hypothetical protein
MLNQRIPFHQSFLKSTQGQLNSLWRDTRGEKIADLFIFEDRRYIKPAAFEIITNDRVRRFKKWADQRHAVSGFYPDHAVAKFLGRLGVEA